MIPVLAKRSEFMYGCGPSYLTQHKSRRELAERDCSERGKRATSAREMTDKP